MIREKTRGNLTAQEAEILNSVLTDLRMAFVQASSSSQPAAAGAPPAQPEAPMTSEEASADSAADSENKKKFSKSYGS
jgi:hypothetical protein